MAELNHKTNLTLPEESHKIIGAAMAVHRYFGCNGTSLSSTFIPDFICYDKIIVELKAVKELEDIHRSQAINYAKVSECPLAILINFGEYSLKFERFPNQNK